MEVREARKRVLCGGLNIRTNLRFWIYFVQVLTHNVFLSSESGNSVASLQKEGMKMVNVCVCAYACVRVCEEREVSSSNVL